MKTFFLSFFVVMAVFLAGKAPGQGSSFIVFTEKGEQFTLFVNGDQQNSKPSDHVRVEDLFGPSFKVRIVFKDPAIPEISKSVFNKPASVMYYVLRPGKKGDYILEHTTSDYVPHEQAVKEETPPPPAGEDKAEQKSETADKKSTGGCTTPMTESDFQVSVAVIYNAPFEANRASSAKKMVETHCLTCRQIAEVMNIASYESSRLSIAKAAYLHCYDPENYDVVKDVLNTTKAKEDLDQYIRSVKQ
jgi:hypothetical protein